MNYFFKSPLLNVLLFSVFWALEIFNTKLAFLAGSEVFRFTFQSSILTFLILSTIIFSKKLSKLKRIPPNLLKLLLLVSALHAGIGGFFSNIGILLTTAINAGFLMQFTTVATTIFAWILLKERITLTKLLSILAILIGSFLLITKGQLLIPHWGDILILIACIAWGLGSVLSRKILKNTAIEPDVVSFFRSFASIPVMVLFLALTPLYPPSLHATFQVDLFAMDNILFVVLNSLFVALMWIFANRTLKFASASYTTMMSSITPILVALLAMVYLNERIEGIQFLGILLIIASSYITHSMKVDKH